MPRSTSTSPARDLTRTRSAKRATIARRRERAAKLALRGGTR